MTPGSPRVAGASVAGLVVVVIATVVAAQLVTGADEDSPSRLSASGSTAATTSGSDGSLPRLPRSFKVQAQPARPAGSQLNDAHPRSVRLPSGTEVPLRAAATSDDGLLQVPDGIRTAGWWDGGSRLGERYGAMLIAGHVDSTSQGLGPFAELLGASRGQKIDVSAAGGRRQRFVVSSVELIPGGTLANREELFSERGPFRLVLVTCAGPFIPSQGGYQNLVIVTAQTVGAFGADMH